MQAISSLLPANRLCFGRAPYASETTFAADLIKQYFPEIKDPVVNDTVVFFRPLHSSKDKGIHWPPFSQISWVLRPFLMMAEILADHFHLIKGALKHPRQKHFFTLSSYVPEAEVRKQLIQRFPWCKNHLKTKEIITKNRNIPAVIAVINVPGRSKCNC